MTMTVNFDNKKTDTFVSYKQQCLLALKSRLRNILWKMNERAYKK